MIQRITHFAVSRFKHWYKWLAFSDYRYYCREVKRLRALPRYQSTTTGLLGRPFYLVDAASFLYMYKEIFEQQIYRFRVQSEHPYIIDGGANIGLSIVYLKQLYPTSRIIAFEPDRKVFKVLKKNIQKFELSNVELVNKAIWSSESIIEFMSEGADGGRMVQLESDRERYQVPTVRLRDYLNKPVDFLKIDIEGAETEVIKDCQNVLSNVKNLFVEYHSFVNQPQTLHLIVYILHEAGFRLHIHPSHTSAQPFYKRNVVLGYDLQLNIFAFRE